MTAALSTEVITVSSTDADIARKMFFVRHKVRHIPLGRDLLNTAPPHEAFRDMCGSHPPPPIREETIRIVSIAELTANKDIHSGIDAVAELVRRGVDCVYVVAGDGEEREALEQHARAVGVDDHVCLSGFIPDAARYLSGFDVYLLPSIKEGMPYVLIEASLAGLPIVATSVIDEEFALQLGRTKIVSPRDVIAMADALQELGVRSRSTTTAEHRFPLSSMVQATVEVYTSRSHQ